MTRREPFAVRLIRRLTPKFGSPKPEVAQGVSCSPLDELDRRQNEVLDQLDELNRQVEALLAEFTARLQDGESEPAAAA